MATRICQATLGLLMLVCMQFHSREALAQAHQFSVINCSKQSTQAYYWQHNSVTGQTRQCRLRAGAIMCKGWSQSNPMKGPHIVMRTTCNADFAWRFNARTGEASWCNSGNGETVVCDKVVTP